MSEPDSQPVDAVPWSAWRTVTGLGAVSLAADMVYEGARSIAGPYLASLGATALVVGLVTGGGEAAALVLRLLFGPLADRSGRYWSLTIAGYAMTAVCVPLMAVAPFLGGAGLTVGATLIILERAGKAVRSPAKSTLLARAAKAVGRGRGIAVHKALDQVGAFAGPLLVAAVVATTSAIWWGLAVLVVPGVVAMVLLFWIRTRVPDISVYDDPQPTVDASLAMTSPAPGLVRSLPREFYVFAVSAGASTLGLMTFGVISFHLVTADLVSAAVVPVVYAAAMAAAAAAALATGYAYDTWGSKVLLVLPFLVSMVPLLAFGKRFVVVLVGVLIWGSAFGVLDSTVKALVADLVPAERIATAYGVFAAFQGVAALAGGGLAGWLYGGGTTDLVLVIAAFQVLSLVLLVRVFRAQAREGRPTKV